MNSISYKAVEEHHSKYFKSSSNACYSSKSSALIYSRVALISSIVCFCNKPGGKIYGADQSSQKDGESSLLF